MGSDARSPVGLDPRRMLWVLLAATAALRAVAWHNATVMTSDGPDFLWQAQRLLAGDARAALSHHYHPLYAALIAACAWPFGGNVVASAVCVSIAAGVAAVAAVYALARRALPGRPDVALCAALLAAVHSTSVTHTSDVRNDGLHAALVVVTIATLFAAYEQGRWRWLAAGATAGLAYLTRPEALFVVVPALIAAAAAARRRGPRAALGGALGFLLALGLVASPYVLALHGLTGRWIISMKPSIAHAGLEEADASKPLPPDCPLASPVVPSPGHAGARPAAASDDESRAAPVGRSAGSDARDVLEAALSAARGDILAFALLGLPAFWQRRRLLLAWAIVLGGWLALAFLHQSASGYINDRHVLSAAILVLPVAGAGYLALWNAPRGRLLLRVVCILLIALITTGAVKRRHPDQRPRLEALAFARDHTSPSDRLVVHRRKDGWYAGRPVVVLTLPCEDADLVDTMRREHAVLLVLDEADVRGAAPHWLDGSLFDTVARFGEGDESVVVLAVRA